MVADSITTTTEPTSTSSTTTITTTSVPEGSLIMPRALDTMPDTWVETFFIPYGDTPDTLGTYLGGDGEGVQFGPAYGAQGPDGTWWFLDVANFRLAHFSERGEYLDDLAVPEEMLVDGVYFQYSFPRVLDDGTVVASRLSGADTVMMRLRGSVFDEVAMSIGFIPRADDGDLVYGHEWETSRVIAANPLEGTTTETEWFRGRGGNRYRLAGGIDGLRVELPDASPPADVLIQFHAEGIGGDVFLSIEVATGEDGSLHIFLLGVPERDENQQLAGYVIVSPDGVVGPIEPVRDPFSSADPSTPTRLGIRPGTSDPWLMFIDEDGVRVFNRR